MGLPTALTPTLLAAFHPGYICSQIPGAAMVKRHSAKFLGTCQLAGCAAMLALMPRASGVRSQPPTAAPPFAGREQTSSSSDHTSTGKTLGPDPYARGAGAGEALDRQRRILESGKSLHRLEIDSPDDLLDQSEDSGLAGLLHGPKNESGPVDEEESRSAPSRKDRSERVSTADAPPNRPIPGSD